MAIKLGQRLPAHIACGKRQEAAGKHLSQMRDEDEAFSVINAARRAPDPVLRACRKPGRQRRRVALPLFFRPTLQKEAAVMLGFGALDIEGNAARSFVQPLKYLLKLIGGDEVDGRA